MFSKGDSDVNFRLLFYFIIGFSNFICRLVFNKFTFERTRFFFPPPELTLRGKDYEISPFQLLWYNQLIGFNK